MEAVLRIIMAAVPVKLAEVVVAQAVVLVLVMADHQAMVVPDVVLAELEVVEAITEVEVLVVVVEVEDLATPL